MHKNAYLGLGLVIAVLLVLPFILPNSYYMDLAIRMAMGVAALPMSICPTAMSYTRPSSEADLVRPVTACLVDV